MDYNEKDAYFICLTIVLFPDSPAPEESKRQITEIRDVILPTCIIIISHSYYSLHINVDAQHLNSLTTRDVDGMI